MSADNRLDALRDMLLEGRNPEALRLIAEIAAEQPKSSRLERLKALRAEVDRLMSEDRAERQAVHDFSIDTPFTQREARGIPGDGSISGHCLWRGGIPGRGHVCPLED